MKNLGCVVLAGAALIAAHAAGAQSFHTIDDPGGGRIIAGTLDSMTAAPEALGALLRHLHTVFGERPGIGNIAADPTGHILGTVFTGTINGVAVTGLAIVGVAPDAPPRAAALFDELSRFPASAPALLAGVPILDAHPLQPLERYVFPDGSGSIGIPAGWQPTQATQGTVVIAGPNGESIVIGLLAPVLDLSNPQAVSLVKSETRSGRPLPGLYTAFAYTDDPVKAYIGVASLFAQKLAKPAPRFTIRSTQTRASYTAIDGEVDDADGHGVKTLAAQVYTMPPSRNGIWGVAVSEVEVPIGLVAAESATVAAICASYAKNDSVADPAARTRIAAIQPIAGATLEPMRVRENAMDRQIAAFARDLGDKAIIAGVAPVEWPDALARGDPQHFKALTADGLLKGIDY